MRSNASTMVKMYSCGYPRDLGSPSATRLSFVSTTSLASQTQPTPAWIAFSITHGEGSDTESDPRWPLGLVGSGLRDYSTTSTVTVELAVVVP